MASSLLILKNWISSRAVIIDTSVSRSLWILFLWALCARRGRASVISGEWRLAGRGVSVGDIVVLWCERRTSLGCVGAWASLGFCLIVVGLSEKAEKLSSAILRSSVIFVSSESRYFWACGNFISSESMYFWACGDFTVIFDWMEICAR